MALSPGTRLGTYEIIGPLGAGGMGEVYRARDVRLGREVAVKVLPEAVASSPERLARFEHEARTVARLTHPNVVVLHSIEEESGIRFLTMELVEGQSLDLLVSPGGLPLSRVLELSIPLADALVAAHERGVVHRDLKPANVMVTPQGRVKVLDFGLAKLMSGEPMSQGKSLAGTSTAPLSVEGQVLGTVPYMAPEQICGDAVDARTDLFALGIILYELSTGRRPFTGPSTQDVVSAILRDTPEPLTNVRADLPGDLDRIVSRCLEKNPRDRAQTALDVLNELRRLKRTLEQGASAKPATQDVASIAILPFVNRSRDEEDEYFSDGLADELINMLAKIRGLRVSARTSSFHFKGKDSTVAEIGSTLRVGTVLEGSVRKSGDRMRISVQLVNVSSGYHLWSETYDRTLEDIFAVQDDIAQCVVKELRTTLLGEGADSNASDQARAEVAAAARGRGTNPEAHRLFLQGRYFLRRFDREHMSKAIGYLHKAIDVDPGYALAWAELSAAHSIEASLGWVPVAEGRERAEEAVKRALELEPELAEAHARLGTVMMARWDWQAADAALRRALELAPGSAVVLNIAGILSSRLDRIEEALEFHRRVLEQEPLAAVPHLNLGELYASAGRLAEAEEMWRMALELAPERPGVRASLARVLLDRGSREEALAEAAREPDEEFRLHTVAIIQHASGRTSESNEALKALIEGHGGTAAVTIAEVHAIRGEVGAAFQWLEKAYARRDDGLTDMKTNPRLRSLHGDPRWGALLKKMGF